MSGFPGTDTGHYGRIQENQPRRPTAQIRSFGNAEHRENGTGQNSHIDTVNTIGISLAVRFRSQTSPGFLHFFQVFYLGLLFSFRQRSVMQDRGLIPLHHRSHIILQAGIVQLSRDGRTHI